MEDKLCFHRHSFSTQHNRNRCKQHLNDFRHLGVVYVRQIKIDSNRWRRSLQIIRCMQSLIQRIHWSFFVLQFLVRMKFKLNTNLTHWFWFRGRKNLYMYYILATLWNQFQTRFISSMNEAKNLDLFFWHFNFLLFINSANVFADTYDDK